jgi:hypothetical protein
MAKAKVRPDPGQCGFLDAEHATTASAFNREMQYRSMPYRMQKLTGRRPDRGHWVLYEIRTWETLHQAPPMDEVYAVHIMRAWMYGQNHAEAIHMVEQLYRGELEDDE